MNPTSTRPPFAHVPLVLALQGIAGLLFSNAALAQQAAAASGSSEATLPEIRIKGGTPAETAKGPVNGYVATRSASGTKTDTPLIETPQSISVVGRTQMTAQAVQTAEQALRYTAGVLTEVTGYDLRYQSIVVRGFAPTIYRDGLRTFAFGSYADWQSEPQGLERVEVVKGPASVLYGQGTPGGIVNQVSKLPSLDAINEVGMQLGNHNRYQATVDTGGKLNADGSLLFRINGLARDSRTQTDHSQDNRLFVAPALTWRPTGMTSVTLLADFTRDRATPKSWWPDRSLLSDSPRIPVKLFAGEPGFDHYNRDQAAIGWLLEHRFNEQWAVRQNLRYSRFKLDYQHVYSNDFVSPTVVSRGSLVSRTSGHATTVDNQLEGRFITGPVQHKVLLGFDAQRASGVEDLGFGTAPNLDVTNPVYGLPVGPVTTDRSNSNQRQNGLYLQDQAKLGNWVLNAGLRRDKATTRYNDANFGLEAKDSKTTYSVGLLHHFDSGFAPYVSYATSFEPAGLFDRVFDGVNPLGSPAKPQTGKQVEAGVKYQPGDASRFVTLAAFELRKQNVTTGDDTNPGFVVQTGEVRARGIELEAQSALTSRLDLIGSLTVLDPKVTRSNNPDQLGHQPPQTARFSAKLWADYRLPQGWAVGAGLRHVSRVAADNANTYWNAAYTLVDAAVRYETGPFTWALNAANLFDKTYTSNRAQFYGQGRVLVGSVNYRW
jgi:iron complex outermembrane receptor protein